MSRAIFNPGKRSSNRVDICPRCDEGKKLAADKYCIKCSIAVLSGEPKFLSPPESPLKQRLFDAVADLTPRDRMIVLSRLLLDEPDLVIFDTETTGVGATDEIVSISIINRDGQTLVSSLVKPTQPITNSYIHGITDTRVLAAPAFPRLYPRICEALDGKVMLAYNTDFDHRMLDQDCKRYHLRPVVPRREACIMEMYAQFYGEWNDYHHNYRWQKLSRAVAQLDITFPGENHNAAADCLAALEVLRAMASTPLETAAETKQDTVPAELELS